MVPRGPEMTQGRPVSTAPGYLMCFPNKTLSGVAMGGVVDASLPTRVASWIVMEFWFPMSTLAPGRSRTRFGSRWYHWRQHMDGLPRAKKECVAAFQDLGLDVIPWVKEWIVLAGSNDRRAANQYLTTKEGPGATKVIGKPWNWWRVVWIWVESEVRSSLRFRRHSQTRSHGVEPSSSDTDRFNEPAAEFIIFFSNGHIHHFALSESYDFIYAWDLLHISLTRENDPQLTSHYASHTGQFSI